MGRNNIFQHPNSMVKLGLFVDLVYSYNITFAGPERWDFHHKQKRPPPLFACRPKMDPPPPLSKILDPSLLSPNPTGLAPLSILDFGKFVNPLDATMLRKKLQFFSVFRQIRRMEQVISASSCIPTRSYPPVWPGHLAK